MDNLSPVASPRSKNLVSGPDVHGAEAVEGKSCASPRRTALSLETINPQPSVPRRFLQLFHYCGHSGDRDTFTIASDQNAHNKAYWSTAGGGAFASAMLSQFGYDRFDNPYVYVVVPVDVSGKTWGVSMNGRINTSSFPRR